MFLTHRQMGIFEAFMKIFPAMKMKDSNIGVEYVPLGKPEEVSRYLVRADEKKEYFDKELFPIKDREGLYYEKPNVIEKYMRRGEQLKEICLAQFVKMYDPSQSVGKLRQEEDDKEDIDDEMEVVAQENENIEKLYGSDAKFHYVIQSDKECMKILPASIKLENPIPDEPIFMKKRKTPKALRFYKPKVDSNPGRFYLQELLLYLPFDKYLFEKWTSNEGICTEEYKKEQDRIMKVKQKVMEWLKGVEEARNYVEETLKNEADTDAAGIDMDAEKVQEIDECEEDGIEEDQQFMHLNPDGLMENTFASNIGYKITKQLILQEREILENNTQKLDEWLSKN